VFIVTAEEDPRIEMSCIFGFICYAQSAKLTSLPIFVQHSNEPLLYQLLLSTSYSV